LDITFSLQQTKKNRKEEKRRGYPYSRGQGSGVPLLICSDFVLLASLISMEGGNIPTERGGRGLTLRFSRGGKKRYSVYYFYASNDVFLALHGFIDGRSEG